MPMIAILLYKTVAHAHVVVVLHADLGNVAALDLAMLQLSRDFVDECVTASASGANVILICVDGSAQPHAS